MFPLYTVASVSWVLNKEATQAAQEKQRQICEQFQDWIFKEPERRQRLVAMLYTQLFQQLYYQADSVHGGRLPVHVHFVMDEFANVALPDEFDKLLSTMRSREISVSIIIQNLAQLKALFEKQWESIVGNCDEFLYLGGNEQSTHEYVSKLLGKETIDTNTYGRSRGRNGSYSTNYQLAGRELMTPDEVRMEAYADKSFDVVIVSNTIIDTSSAFNENSSACLNFIRCNYAL